MTLESPFNGRHMPLFQIIPLPSSAKASKYTVKFIDKTRQTPFIDNTWNVIHDLDKNILQRGTPLRPEKNCQLDMIGFSKVKKSEED